MPAIVNQLAVYLVNRSTLATGTLVTNNVRGFSMTERLSEVATFSFEISAADTNANLLKDRVYVAVKDGSTTLCCGPIAHPTTHRSEQGELIMSITGYALADELSDANIWSTFVIDATVTTDQGGSGAIAKILGAAGPGTFPQPWTAGNIEPYTRTNDEPSFGNRDTVANTLSAYAGFHANYWRQAGVTTRSIDFGPTQSSNAGYIGYTDAAITFLTREKVSVTGPVRNIRSQTGIGIVIGDVQYRSIAESVRFSRGLTASDDGRPIHNRLIPNGLGTSNNDLSLEQIYTGTPTAASGAAFPFQVKRKPNAQLATLGTGVLGARAYDYYIEDGPDGINGLSCSQIQYADGGTTTTSGSTALNATSVGVGSATGAKANGWFWLYDINTHELSVLCQIAASYVSGTTIPVSAVWEVDGSYTNFQHPHPAGCTVVFNPYVAEELYDDQEASTPWSLYYAATTRLAELRKRHYTFDFECIIPGGEEPKVGGAYHLKAEVNYGGTTLPLLHVDTTDSNPATNGLPYGVAGAMILMEKVVSVSDDTGAKTYHLSLFNRQKSFYDKLMHHSKLHRISTKIPKDYVGSNIGGFGGTRHVGGYYLVPGDGNFHMESYFKALAGGWFARLNFQGTRDDCEYSFVFNGQESTPPKGVIDKSTFQGIEVAIRAPSYTGGVTGGQMIVRKWTGGGSNSVLYTLALPTATPDISWHTGSSGSRRQKHGIMVRHLPVADGAGNLAYIFWDDDGKRTDNLLALTTADLGAYTQGYYGVRCSVPTGTATMPEPMHCHLTEWDHHSHDDKRHPAVLANNVVFHGFTSDSGNKVTDDVNGNAQLVSAGNINSAGTDGVTLTALNNYAYFETLGRSGLHPYRYGASFKPDYANNGGIALLFCGQGGTPHTEFYALTVTTGATASPPQSGTPVVQPIWSLGAWKVKNDVWTPLSDFLNLNQADVNLASHTGNWFKIGAHVFPKMIYNGVAQDHMPGYFKGGFWDAWDHHFQSTGRNHLVTTFVSNLPPDGSAGIISPHWPPHYDTSAALYDAVTGDRWYNSEGRLGVMSFATSSTGGIPNGGNAWVHGAAYHVDGVEKAKNPPGKKKSPHPSSHHGRKHLNYQLVFDKNDNLAIRQHDKTQDMYIDLQVAKTDGTPDPAFYIKLDPTGILIAPLLADLSRSIQIGDILAFNANFSAAVPAGGLKQGTIYGGNTHLGVKPGQFGWVSKSLNWASSKVDKHLWEMAKISGRDPHTKLLVLAGHPGSGPLQVHGYRIAKQAVHKKNEHPSQPHTKHKTTAPGTTPTKIIKSPYRVTAYGIPNTFCTVQIDAHELAPHDGSAHVAIPAATITGLSLGGYVVFNNTGSSFTATASGSASIANQGVGWCGPGMDFTADGVEDVWILARVSYHYDAHTLMPWVTDYEHGIHEHTGLHIRKRAVHPKHKHPSDPGHKKKHHSAPTPQRAVMRVVSYA